jgi:hypothetical protein
MDSSSGMSGTLGTWEYMDCSSGMSGTLCTLVTLGTHYSWYLAIYGLQLRDDVRYSGCSRYLGIYGPQLRDARYSGYLGGIW